MVHTIPCIYLLLRLFLSLFLYKQQVNSFSISFKHILYIVEHSHQNTIIDSKDHLLVFLKKPSMQ